MFRGNVGMDFVSSDFEVRNEWMTTLAFERINEVQRVRLCRTNVHFLEVITTHRPIICSITLFLEFPS